MSELGRKTLESFGLNETVDKIAEDLGYGPLSDEQKQAIVLAVFATAAGGTYAVSNIATENLNRHIETQYYRSDPTNKPADEVGERMAESIMHKEHTTGDELLRASFSGDWPPKGLNVLLDNPQKIDIRNIVQTVANPQGLSPDDLKKAPGTPAGNASVIGPREIGLNDYYLVDKPGEHGRSRLNSTLGHEGVHILQGDNLHRSNEAYGVNAEQLSVHDDPYDFSSNQSVEEFFEKHMTDAEKAAGYGDGFRYYSEGIEMQARLHQIMMVGYSEWGRLPANKEELKAALQDAGIMEVVNSDDLWKQSTAIERHETFSGLNREGSMKPFGPANDINDVLSRVSPEDRAHFFKQIMPELYADLIEMYGDKEGRARFDLGENTRFQARSEAIAMQYQQAIADEYNQTRIMSGGSINTPPENLDKLPQDILERIKSGQITDVRTELNNAAQRAEAMQVYNRLTGAEAGSLEHYNNFEKLYNADGTNKFTIISDYQNALALEARATRFLAGPDADISVSRFPSFIGSPSDVLQNKELSEIKDAIQLSGERTNAINKFNAGMPHTDFGPEALKKFENLYQNGGIESVEHYIKVQAIQTVSNISTSQLSSSSDLVIQGEDLDKIGFEKLRKSLDVLGIPFETPNRLALGAGSALKIIIKNEDFDKIRSLETPQAPILRGNESELHNTPASDNISAIDKHTDAPSESPERLRADLDEGSKISAIAPEPARLSDSFIANDALEDGLSAAKREISFLERFGADDQDAVEDAIKKLEALSASNAETTADDFTRAMYDARISEVSARTYLAAENIKDAERAAETVKNFYAQYPDDLRTESAALYDDFSNAYLEAAKEHIDTAPEKAEQLFAKALDYSNLQHAVDEGPLDADARYVAQSEVGFSSRQPIGTDNIRECIVLALRDNTGRVALAHIDYSTDANSLDAILKHLNTDGPIEAKVIGGDTASPEGLKNIDVADTFLQANNIDVVAANVGGGHVSAIVVDPQTFEIKNAVPMQGRAESALQNGLAASVAGDSTQFKGTEKPIRIGYDDAIGKAHESVSIRPHQVAGISQDMLGNSPLQTYIAMEEKGQMSRGLMLFDQIYAVHHEHNKNVSLSIKPQPASPKMDVVANNVENTNISAVGMSTPTTQPQDPQASYAQDTSNVTPINQERGTASPLVSAEATARKLDLADTLEDQPSKGSAPLEPTLDVAPAPQTGLQETFNHSAANEIPPTPDNVQSIGNKIDALEAAADTGKASAKGARLLKAGVVTTVAATAAGIVLTEYAHNQQQELAKAYHEAGLLSDNAFADYNEMNENVKNIVIAETTFNQLPLLGVAIGMAATEATARSHFNDWLEDHGPLDDELYQALKMDMLGGSSLKAQFAMAGAEMIPRDLSAFPPELHSLWEAKQRMDNAQNAIPGGIRTRDGALKAQRAEAIAEKTEIYDQEKAAYQGEFDRLLSDPSTAAQMLDMMPQDLLLEMVDQTAMARANNTHDPTIQRIAEIKDQLDDGLGGRKNASKRATLTRKLEDLKEELEQNPEKMHGYIRDVFGGHKTDAPAPASPKIDTEAPSQFAQHDEQTQDRLIDELAQDAKTSDDLKNTHPYIKELADLTAGIERLESNREGKSARQLSKMGRNAQNLRAANERLETVKDEIKANPSIMDRALPSQSPLSSHPLDNVAGDKNLIQEAQNMGIDIKTMPAAVATMQTDNTFQAPQI